MTLEDGAKALLNRPLLAWVTTLDSAGSPHNTVVWIDVDDDDVVFNTAVGRAKERHLRKNPTASVSVLDPDNAYHWLTVTGTAKFELDGADAHIDRLAKKYLGVDTYPGRQAGEVRVIVRIKPDKAMYRPGS